MTLATKRLLVGRKIVGFELRPFGNCDITGKKLRNCYDPVIILDNGARVAFAVAETDQGDCYGITPTYYPKQGKPK